MSSPILERLEHPVIAAPMGGGPSTPELAAAVSEAGGLGFLAAGYKSAAGLEEEIAATRALTDRPFGVNVFVPGPPADPGAYAGYVERIAEDAARLGTEVGEPRYSDDDWIDKLALLAGDPVAVVSFTFGAPDPAGLEPLRSAGSEIWVTVTRPAEARAALGCGSDALIVQGVEAGAHQGSFEDDPNAEPYGLLALLQLVAAEVELPLIATGAIATGAGVAAVLAAGAAAAQLGSAFMLCPEAGTSEVHRAALATRGQTQLTRAFTGKPARGIVNDFLTKHPDAPGAYPEILYATAPIRAAARDAGDPSALNLWAGQAHHLAREIPAGELVAQLAAEARHALESARRP